MKKIGFLAIAAPILGGCASSPNRYQYITFDNVPGVMDSVTGNITVYWTDYVTGGVKPEMYDPRAAAISKPVQATSAPTTVPAEEGRLMGTEGGTGGLYGAGYVSSPAIIGALSTLGEKISTLKQLKKSGVITSDEYVKAKTAEIAEFGDAIDMPDKDSVLDVLYRSADQLDTMEKKGELDSAEHNALLKTIKDRFWTALYQ